ncbi:hypothetical protein D3C84_640780 [compost metagenome]
MALYEDFGDARSYFAVFQRWPAVETGIASQVDEVFQGGAVTGLVGDGVAFDHQRLDRHLEAAVDLTQALLVRDEDFIEKDLVEILFLAQAVNWLDGDARRLHIEEEVGEAGVLRQARVSTGDHHSPVGNLRPTSPDFLATEQPATFRRHGFQTQGGEVGTSRGL